MGFWLIICRGFESWVLIIGLNPIDKIALPWIWIMGFDYRVESHWQNSIAMNLNHGLWLWTWIMDLNSIDKIVLPCVWIMGFDYVFESWALIMNFNSIDKIFFPYIWIMDFSNIAKYKNSWTLEKNGILTCSIK